jgi:hypothetical protein
VDDNARMAWRAAAPLFTTGGLEALREALWADDPTLLQHETVRPIALQCFLDDKPLGACPWGYAAIKSWHLDKVSEVTLAFSRVCQAVDEATGADAGCRWFLNFVDETPREQMRLELLEEVDIELARRSGQESESVVTEEAVS